ncbi:hypothetical protein NA56DRAFT_279650 [Hyaloscypha hepaticicola]|uniref:Uncharacterized protein n=1 Tax=Hyaloscypha hepaticicola TaxID=2082293 RepID=A0A2J6PSW7_9HELO|nr:hypothetical protein NA56DRAFT_279650 [Hyaloscypha hepaticicola]
MAWNGTALLFRERFVALAWSLQSEWTDKQTKDLNKMALYPPAPPRSNVTFHNSSQCKSVTKKSLYHSPKTVPCRKRKPKPSSCFWFLWWHSCFHPSYPSPRRTTRRCGQRTPLFPLWLAPAAPEPRPRGLLARPPPVVPRACPPGLLGS